MSLVSSRAKVSDQAGPSLSGKRVLISAGGTGGHVFPGLAVAEVLQTQGAEVHWVGTARGIESKLVPTAGLPLHTVSVIGLRGKGLKAKIGAAWLALRGGMQCWRLLRQIRPVVVVGFGGYVTGPVGLMARLLSIPLVIHEQNSVAGLTNRLLAKISQKVLTGFPQVTLMSGTRTIYVGNPVRRRLEQVRAQRVNSTVDDRVVNILVVGGSLGSKKLNQIVPEAVNQLQQSLNEAHQAIKQRANQAEDPEMGVQSSVRVSVWHQCGAHSLGEMQSQHVNYCRRHEVTAFIDDMAAAYEWADIMICRAGALTVSELAAIGLPALFIPFPHAVDNHQFCNAKQLADVGAAEIILEQALTPDLLASRLKALIQSVEKRVNMAEQGRKLGKLDAATRVVTELVEVIS